MQNPKLKITSYSDKGYGRAYHDNRVYDVLLSGLDQELTAQVIKKQKKRFLCKILESHASSPFVTTAPCQHVAFCGGCTMQHLQYDHQLNIKRDKAQKLYEDLGVIEDIIPSLKLFHYRNKMEFTFSQNRDGEKFLGLIMPASKGWVHTIQTCHIAHPNISTALNIVQDWWLSHDFAAYNPPKGQGFLRTLMVRSSTQNEGIHVVLEINQLALDQEKNLAISELSQTLLHTFKDLGFFVKAVTAIKGQPTAIEVDHRLGLDRLKEEINVTYQGIPVSIELKAHPLGFLQPNMVMANQIYQTALELSGIHQDDTVMDLYSGSGSIAMVLSKFCKKVIAVEGVEEAVEDAFMHFKANHIENVEMHQGDCSYVLQQLSKEKHKVDVVFVDPPRSGLMPDVIQHIADLKPRALVYISCNPKTHSLDLASFKEKGYEISRLKLVDQFPHTPHVESIAVLTRTQLE